MSNTVDSLKGCINSVLGVRDKIGAALAPCKIVTRTWSGNEIGHGHYSDSEVGISPSPRIVDYGHSLSLREAGQYKSGDLLLRQISKQSFPNESDIDGRSGQSNVEKFYRVGSKRYQVIHIKDNHLWWDVHLRPITERDR